MVFHPALRPNLRPNRPSTHSQPTKTLGFVHHCIQAVVAGDVSAVVHALRDGASPNALRQDWTALMFAASAGHIGALRLLAEHGANVETPMNDGATPVYIAACNGHEEVVKQLLDALPSAEAARPKNRQGLASPRSPLHLDSLEGRRNSVSDGRMT